MIRVISPNTDEFEDLWTKAEYQLTRLSNRYPEEVDWNVEYILSCIDNAQAAFMVCDDGFYIARDNGPHLDIWIAAAFDGRCDILATKLAELEKVAKDSGFEAITFSTVRRGWSRIAADIGLEVLASTVTYIYRGQNEEIGTKNPSICAGE